MKILYDYNPMNSSDSTMVITATGDTNYPIVNIKDINPNKCWRSTGVVNTQSIVFNLLSGANIVADSLFINRINFAEFYIQGNNDTNWHATPGDNAFNLHVTGVTKDEIYEENYMHYFAELTAFNYKYLRIYIPVQLPLFEATYFKIGNILIGNAVEIYNPKSGYSIDIISKVNMLEFDSGNISEYKTGKTRRNFSGNFDKISNIEYNKIRFTRNPVVLYHNWEGNPQKCYLVKHVGNFKRSYDYAAITSHQLNWTELV